MNRCAIHGSLATPQPALGHWQSAAQRHVLTQAHASPQEQRSLAWPAQPQLAWRQRHSFWFWFFFVSIVFSSASARSIARVQPHDEHAAGALRGPDDDFGPRLHSERVT